MKITKLSLPGVLQLEAEQQSDERGFFARTFCKRELSNVGVSFDIAQTNVSYNQRSGILRGLHFQAAPHAEAKVVSCTQGAIFDVVVPGIPDACSCALRSGD